MANASESGSDSAWEYGSDVLDIEEIDAANDSELKLYASTEFGLDLEGSDADLAWVAWDAFNAPPPENWTEHHDGQHVFYHNRVTKETSWSHPGDKIYKELLDIVKPLRAQRPVPSEKQRCRLMHEHLMEMHRLAEAELAGWCGPYVQAADGASYYHHEERGDIAWSSPSEHWEKELALRQAVLHRCLLQEWPSSLVPPTALPASREISAADLKPSALSLETLEALSTTGDEGPDDDDSVSLCSAKSFITMHSARSVRTTRSTRSVCAARPPRAMRAESKTAGGVSPQVMRRDPAEGALPPLVQPARPPALQRVHSDALPRFGAADLDTPRAEAIEERRGQPKVEIRRAGHQTEQVAESRSMKLGQPGAAMIAEQVETTERTSARAEADKGSEGIEDFEDLEGGIGLQLQRRGEPPMDVRDAREPEDDQRLGEPLEEPEEVAAGAQPQPGKLAIAAVDKALPVVHEIQSDKKDQQQQGGGKAVDLCLKNAVVGFLEDGARPSLELEPFVNPEHRERAWDIVKQYQGLRCEIVEGRMQIFREEQLLKGDDCSVKKQTEDCVDAAVDSLVVDNADVAGGVAADATNQGDAAVLALVASSRPPETSPDRLTILEQDKQPSDNPTVTSDGSTAQYFNLWEQDPNDDSEEQAERVHQWLCNLGLGRYFEDLAAEGFDDMNILACIEDDQIDDLMKNCPMPMLHEQHLRRGLSQLRSSCELSGVS